MIYGYARVSTKGQAKDGNSLEDQTRALREKGALTIYEDSVTGTKTDRPALAELLAALQAGDTLMVTKLDRFARSAQQGMALIDDLLSKGIEVDILNIGRMNNTATGKLIRNIMLSFAEFERDCIVERTQAGKAIARENPEYREGRPPVNVDAAKLSVLKAKVASGECSKAQAARELGIGRTTWYKIAG